MATEAISHSFAPREGDTGLVTWPRHQAGPDSPNLLSLPAAPFLLAVLPVPVVLWSGMCSGRGRFPTLPGCTGVVADWSTLLWAPGRQQPPQGLGLSGPSQRHGLQAVGSCHGSSWSRFSVSRTNQVQIFSGLFERPEVACKFSHKSFICTFWE